MAITIDTLPAPTGFTAADSAQAGDLTPGSTWHYRIFATGRGYRSTYIDSPWAAEITHTLGPTATAVDLSWNPVAPYQECGYLILMTQVSGEYDEKGKHSFQYGFGLSGTTWTHTNPSPSMRIWYRPSGVPNIIVEGGSAATPLDFEDIYDADVAGDWNRVDRKRVKGAGAEPYIEYNAGSPRPQMTNTWVIDASLTFGDSSDCYFKETNSSIIVLGAMRFSDTYTKLFQLGEKSGDKYPEAGCELEVRGHNGITLAGICNFYGSRFIAGSQEYGTFNRCSSRGYKYHSWIALGLSTSSDAIVNWDDARIHAFNGFTKRDSGFLARTRRIGGFSGISMYNGNEAKDISLIGSRTTCFWIGYTNSVIGENTYRRCRSEYYSNVDMRWGYVGSPALPQHLVDCYFNAKGQENEDIHCYFVAGGSGLLPPLHFEHEFDPIFVDTQGNILEGYSVILKDAFENVVISNVTDSNGKLTGGLRDVLEYILEKDDSMNSGWGWMSEKIASGEVIKTKYTPHILTVSKDGTTYLEAAINIQNSMKDYIIVDTTGEPVYPAITKIELVDGDKDNLEKDHEYTLEVTVDASGASDTWSVRSECSCVDDLGLTPEHSEYGDLAPGESRVDTYHITPTQYKTYRIQASVREESTGEIVDCGQYLDVTVPGDEPRVVSEIGVEVLVERPQLQVDGSGPSVQVEVEPIKVEVGIKQLEVTVETGHESTEVSA